MPELYTSGIEVQESPQHEQSIASAPTSITAFVGRTQRGPVDEPVRVESFAQFQRVFGGLWGLSTLSFAVDQFFAHGGSVAIIVRVINGGAGVSIDLPAGDQVLRLRARHPGTHEVLRASVDHDGIDRDDHTTFNLLIQRLSQQAAEHVLGQEGYRRVSVLPGHDRCIGTLLADSAMVRLEGELPAARPDRTPPPSPERHVGYIHANRDGHDGDPLSDYDIIGSASRRTGMFALTKVDQFNLLCLPPLERSRDVGLVSWLAGVRFCKRRRAMLIMDPPLSWRSADEALAGLRKMNFASEDAIMSFPRLRLLGGGMQGAQGFAPCGAVAGIIARSDQRHGVWHAPAGEHATLNGRLRPMVELDAGDIYRLAAAGVNGFQTGRPGAACTLASARTMAGGDCSAPSWNYIAARRLSLMILESVERGTRWAVFEHSDARLWALLREQVDQFLLGIWEQGGLCGDDPSQAFYVMCDAETNTGPETELGGVNIVIGIALRRPAEFVTFAISQQRDGAVVNRSNLNPYASYAR